MDISLFGELRYNYRSVYKILPPGNVANIYQITVSGKSKTQLPTVDFVSMHKKDILEKC
jgi:hypothetical protein